MKETTFYSLTRLNSNTKWLNEKEIMQTFCHAHQIWDLSPDTGLIKICHVQYGADQLTYMEIRAPPVAMR